MRVFLIDNNDSFTYNLKHYIEQFANEVVVSRSAEIELDDIEPFDKIILSSILENDYFRKVKESENSNLDRSYNLYDKNISQIDTLRKVYEKVLLEDAKNSSLNWRR